MNVRLAAQVSLPPNIIAYTCTLYILQVLSKSVADCFSVCRTPPKNVAEDTTETEKFCRMSSIV